MLRDEVVEKWQRLLHEEEHSEARRFSVALNWLQTSVRILCDNYKELAAIPQAVQQTEDQGRRIVLHNLFIRRLHNYLASVKSAVDHTRTFMARHNPSSVLEADYARGVRQLKDNPVVPFLQAFRNPVLHAQLPNVTLLTTFPAGELRRQLVVKVFELNEMYEWTSAAKVYIETQQEGYYADSKYIDLGAAAERYQQRVEAFYKWFFDAVEADKVDLLRGLSELRSEIGRLQHQIQEIDASKSSI